MILHLILIFAMATSAVAFEQIYAINAGGEKDHTDADGIFYTAKKSAKSYDWGNIGNFFLYNFPKSDWYIYQWTEYAILSDTPNYIEYQIPLKSDGLYVLIAKFTIRGERNDHTFNMTLNNKIQLLSNVDQVQQCGGSGHICDEHFYLCVSDKTIYYKEQSSPIQNEIIHIKIHPLRGFAFIAGLVLLKGTLGERKKLISSETKGSLFFDPVNMNRCTVAGQIQMVLEEQRQSTDKLKKRLATLSETIAKTYAESTSVKDLQKQQNSISIQLQGTMNQFAENNLKNISNLNSAVQSSFKSVQVTCEKQISSLLQLHKSIDRSNEISLHNISNLNAIIQSSFENTRAATVREIESLQKKLIANFESMDIKIEASLKNFTELLNHQISNIRFEMKTTIEEINRSNENNWKNISNQVQVTCKDNQVAIKNLEKQQSNTSEQLHRDFTEILNQQISSIRNEMISSIKEINRSNENSLNIILNQNAVIQDSFKGVQVTNENTQVAIKNLEKQQSDRADQLHKSFESSSEISLTNISNLKVVIQSTFENTQAAIICEIESVEQRITKSMDIQIEASLKNFTELLNHQISNNIRFEMKSTVEGINRSNENNLKNISNQVQVTSENTQVAIKNLEKQQSDRSDQLQNSIQRSSDISLTNNSNLNAVIHGSFEAANDKIQSAVKNLHQQHSDTFNKLTNNNLNSIANLNAVIQSLFVNTQVTILREIQSLQKSQNEIVSRYESAEQRMLKSLELKNEASTQQTSNKNTETLQADVRQLAQKTEKMSLEFSEMKTQLNVIQDLVMSIIESTR
jgi:hypothetical protein